jgi:hypothetical protein
MTLYLMRVTANLLLLEKTLAGRFYLALAEEDVPGYVDPPSLDRDSFCCAGTANWCDLCGSSAPGSLHPNCHCWHLSWSMGGTEPWSAGSQVRTLTINIDCIWFVLFQAQQIPAFRAFACELALCLAGRPVPKELVDLIADFAARLMRLPRLSMARTHI